MSQFHHLCLTLKLWLDAQVPEGSAGVLLFLAAAFQLWLERVGFVAWAKGRFEADLVAKLVARGPTVILATLWGWATLGVFSLDTAAKGFVVGVLGPLILAKLRGLPRPPLASSLFVLMAAGGCGFPGARSADATFERQLCLFEAEGAHDRWADEACPPEQAVVVDETADPPKTVMVSVAWEDCASRDEIMKSLEQAQKACR